MPERKDMGMDFLGDVPPEVKQAIQEQFDRKIMNIEERYHAIRRALDEMSLEQLQAFDTILNQVAGSSDSPIASYYGGLISSTIYHRFGICSFCRVNHDEELTKVAAPAPHQHDVKVEDILPSSDLSVQDLANMSSYGLDDLRDEDTNELLGFVCINCGLRYVSIADRMLRPPGIEGCSGCMQKAKWG